MRSYGAAPVPSELPACDHSGAVQVQLTVVDPMVESCGRSSAGTVVPAMLCLSSVPAGPFPSPLRHFCLSPPSPADVTYVNPPGLPGNGYSCRAVGVWRVLSAWDRRVLRRVSVRSSSSSARVVCWRCRCPAVPLPARLRPRAFAASPLGPAPCVTHPSCHGAAPAGRSIPPKPRCPMAERSEG